MGLVLSLILMLVYYLAFIGGTRIAGNAQFSPFLGAWLPNLGFRRSGNVPDGRSDREHENPLLSRSHSDAAGFPTSGAVRPRAESVSADWAYSLTHHPKFFRLLDIYVLRGFWFFFILVLIVFVSLFILVTLFELLPDIVKNNVDTSIVVELFRLSAAADSLLRDSADRAARDPDRSGNPDENQRDSCRQGRRGQPLSHGDAPADHGPAPFGRDLLPAGFHAALREPAAGRISQCDQRAAPQTYRDPQRKWMVGSGDQIYHYTYFDPNQNLFGGISIFIFQPKTFELSEWIFAQRAHVDWIVLEV